MTTKADFQDWVGRSETTRDVAAAGPLDRLADLLDHDAPPWAPDEVPPLGHWLSFLPRARQSELDLDGHPKRGGFLPPIELPRRMWAGSRVSFHAPIPVGAAIERRSTILSVTPKGGASGEMVFVTVRHEVFEGGRLAISEEQDLVYREMGAAAAAQTAEPPASEWTRVVTPDPRLLFRFSALTFNTHRIHYDRPYTTGVEGYPALVVHGPLIATLLMDHWLRRHPGVRPTGFSFRAQRPLYDDAAFELRMMGNDLWAVGPSGEIAMKAQITPA